MVIRIIYTLFLGILVALFVGWGIAAFYPAPEAPTYPDRLIMKSETAPTESAEDAAAREAYDKAQKTYSKETFPTYNRNVSIIAIVAAIAVLVISLLALKKIELLSDGLLLGGVMLTLYAIIRGLMGNDPKYGFVVVAIGLVVALVLGYVKFIHPEKSSAK